MRVRPGLDENFRFIALEVQKQIDDTRAYVVAPNPDLHETIAARDDYVDHLKSVVENKCFALVAQAEEPLPTRRVNQIRAIQAITTNLERIGDYCVNIVGQMGYLSQPSFITRYDCDAFFDVIREALALVVPVTFEPQIQPALQLCRSEHRLDELYRDVFHAIVKQLHERAHTEDLITALFIVRYLERIGDALLNIGEALIFAIVGEKLKVHQYEALEGSLVAITQAQGDSDRVPRDALHIESFWDSRSGCRIGRLRHEGNELAPRWVIFKEGRLKKIEREKSNLERWSAIEPGLVPRVFDFHANAEIGTLLVEYLSAKTFQRVLLEPLPDLYEPAIAALAATMRRIWSATRDETPFAGRFMTQLEQRLPDVLQLHPSFETKQSQIGGMRMRSLEEMIARAKALEARLTAPFRVFLHGDFNTDNVLYDDRSATVHYIDVYRSGPGDYAQDVAVFIVSDFRLPELEPALRRRLDMASVAMLRFARKLAAEWGDETFECRLALGLARSFITSTRFSLDPSFAKRMFHRSLYLLERIGELDESSWGRFRVPDEIVQHF